MGDRGPSITFSAYLTGGVPDGAPLWREPPAEPWPGEDAGNAPALSGTRAGTSAGTGAQAREGAGSAPDGDAPGVHAAEQRQHGREASGEGASRADG